METVDTTRFQYGPAESADRQRAASRPGHWARWRDLDGRARKRLFGTARDAEAHLAQMTNHG
jgi:hypothetical protein